jgi:hypothetical protein
MNNQQVPGLLYPTVNGQLANNPRDSSIAAADNTAIKMNMMSNELAGGRRKRYRRGGANESQIVVPQFQMNYTPQNGPNQDPNAQIQQNAAIGTQATANAVYDSQALKMGGGDPKWNWGCSSGGSSKGSSKGSKRKYRRSRKTRKHRRTFKKKGRRHNRK